MAQLVGFVEKTCEGKTCFKNPFFFQFEIVANGVHKILVNRKNKPSLIFLLYNMVSDDLYNLGPPHLQPSLKAWHCRLQLC